MRIALLIAPLLAVTLATAAQAGTRNILFIIDVSGSMAGKIDDETKMAAAKRAFGAILNEISEDTRVAVEVYGHQGDRDCSAIELLSPIQPLDRQRINAVVDKLSPEKGATPISAALKQGADVIRDAEGAKTMILISDGKENCGGDPVATAKGIRERQGIDVTIHVVGFGVAGDETEQLEGIALAGGGEYFAADSAEALTASLSEAVKPEPVFFDDFEGQSLGESWMVENPVPDAFLVENSELLLLGVKPGRFDLEDTPNLLTLDQPLPDGDWNARIRFTGEFKTDRENIYLGLRDDKENYIAARLYTYRETCSDIVLTLEKMSGGKRNIEKAYVRGGRGCSKYSSTYDYAGTKDRMEKTPATLTLAKRGRSYHAELDLGETDGEGNPRIYKTERLTSLRAPEKLAVAMGKWKETGGEFLLLVDSVEIEKLPE